MLPRSIRVPWLALHPVPVLHVSIGVDDEVFAHRLVDIPLDLLPSGVIGQGPGRIRHVLIGNHTALMGDSLERVSLACDRDCDIRSAVVPAEFLNKERLKFEALQVLFDSVSVKRHAESS